MRLERQEGDAFVGAGGIVPLGLGHLYAGGGHEDRPWRGGEHGAAGEGWTSLSSATWAGLRQAL